MCAEPLKPFPLDLCRGQVHGESQPVAYIPASVATDQAVEHSRDEAVTRSHRANGKDVSAAAVPRKLRATSTRKKLVQGLRVRCRRAKWGGRHGAPEQRETSRWGNLLNDRNGLVTAFDGTVDDLLRRLAHGGSLRTPSAYE
ncbi:uncharacterized protein Triagg1_10081 [Trichoderma aggressivum f. europaeum]|uniref:Uncharacterized protein n=1 Tax=Trichoderma aggressivum f. europaeum TaxID=173218 RepID=A0AAE1LWK4_9HYPO|nr:hypothetical protein Triagg1_10081 [Trichoderma aggressivum f. europaeum]